LRLWIIAAALSLLAVSNAAIAFTPPAAHRVAASSFERQDSRFRPSGLPIVVLAAGEAVPAADSSPAVEPSKPSVFLQLAGSLADLVMTGLLALIGMLIAYLRSKSATDKAAHIGLVITEAARAAVLELDATIKPKLKEYLSDGVLSDVEKADLKARALEILKTKLPAGVLSTAATVFGAAFLDTYLGGKIEQAVSEKNAVQAAGEPAPKPEAGTKVEPLAAVPQSP
jgi:hypothetical protein